MRLAALRNNGKPSGRQRPIVVKLVCKVSGGKTEEQKHKVRLTFALSSTRHVINYDYDLPPL